MSYVKRDPRFRITDLQAIAAILYEDDPHRDSFWTNQARNAFLAASLYLWESFDQQTKAHDAKTAQSPHGPPDVQPPIATPDVPTLGQIYRLFSGDGQTDLKTYLSQLAQQDYLSRDCKTAFANLTALAEQTFTSVIGSFQEPLHSFLNPILDEATSGDIQEVTSQFSAQAQGNGGVLYSRWVGKVESQTIAVEIAKRTGLQIIDNTPIAKFLDENFEAIRDEVARIFVENGKDPFQANELAINILFGDGKAPPDSLTSIKNSLWGRASDEFSRSLRGPVILVAS